MNLHRALEHEWNDVPLQRRNRWQRLAAASHGYVTPGNVISVGGLVLTAVGLLLLDHDSWCWAVVLLIAGRLADMADGFVADKTGTKSPIGEAVDAISDKLVVLAVLVVFAVLDILPLVALILIVLHNATNALVSAVGRAKGAKIHPTAFGKLSTFFEWTSIFGFALAASPIRSSWMLSVAWIVMLISFFLGLVSLGQYTRQVRTQRSGS